MPRFCEFEPNKAASIYCSEVALVEVCCQGCKHIFHVAFSSLNMGTVRIADAIKTNALHYGDPPNVRCCAGGPTMNSEPQRVLQYWSRYHEKYTEPFGSTRRVTDLRFDEWVRDETFEIDIELDWKKLRAPRQV